jgi:DNA-binding NarL/FixJ family response regulator
MPRMKTLTKIQREILRRRAAGVSFKEIAWERKRSLKTIEYHWHCIQDSVGLHDVVAVCRWAWKRGMA